MNISNYKVVLLMVFGAKIICLPSQLDQRKMKKIFII